MLCCSEDDACSLLVVGTVKGVLLVGFQRLWAIQEHSPSETPYITRLWSTCICCMACLGIVGGHAFCLPFLTKAVNLHGLCKLSVEEWVTQLPIAPADGKGRPSFYFLPDAFILDSSATVATDGWIMICGCCTVVDPHIGITFDVFMANLVVPPPALLVGDQAAGSACGLWCAFRPCCEAIGTSNSALEVLPSCKTHVRVKACLIISRNRCAELICSNRLASTLVCLANRDTQAHTHTHTQPGAVGLQRTSLRATRQELATR